MYSPPRTEIPFSASERRVSGDSFPSSISVHAASAVIILVIEPIWKT